MRCEKYKIISNEQIAKGVYDLRFEAPEMASESKPGQFYNIACGDGNLLRRPISVCDVEGDVIRIVYEVKGSGTKYLAGLKSGGEVDVFGPLGNGFKINKDVKTILIGGGIGVFPLLFAARQCQGNAVSVLGYRSCENAVMTDEFDRLCASSTICSDDGSIGFCGVSTDAARDVLRDYKAGMILACGPKPMLKAVQALANELKIPAQISLEERMGCGIGACLVCACKTKKDGEEKFSHVCKDGPVFDSAEVVF